MRASIGNQSKNLAVRAEKLVALIVWIDCHVPQDPTREYGAGLCDLVAPNRGTLEELHGRIQALARRA